MSSGGIPVRELMAQIAQAIRWNKFVRGLREENRFVPRDAAYFDSLFAEALVSETTLAAGTTVYRARIMPPERETDTDPLPKVNEVLTTVSGVALLRYLLAQTPERLAAIAVPGIGMNIESYPTMLPVNAYWPAAFGRALRADGAKEGAVALMLFGIPAENLRNRARESTALVARILARAGHEYDKDVAWRLDVDPQGEWKKWCGGVA